MRDFNKAIDVLVKAYLNDTLHHGWPCGCAVGNLIADAYKTKPSTFPDKYENGKVISGLDNIQNKDVVIFHAGTKIKENKIFTNGGRVLGITATGDDLKKSLLKAYETLESSVSFEGMQYRRDIGKKALE